jgi:nucleoside-diphosphate-sugar epimerase
MRRPAVAAAALSARLTGSRFVTPAIVSDLFAYKYYSSARAERELGWTAQRSFSDSVARAWSFYKAEGLA